MDKPLKIILMVCVIVLVLVVSGSMIYYFVFFRTEKDRAEIKLQEEMLELEKQKIKQEAEAGKIEQNKKTELSDKLTNLEIVHTEALQEAYDNYIKNWNDSCERLGLEPESALPENIAKHIEEQYQEDIENINNYFNNLRDSIYKLYE